MQRVQIYDPAAGCSTGACGPDAADEQERFEQALEALRARGVQVERYNLGHEPEAFSENAVVKAAIRASGLSSLPMVLVDGQVVSQGAYPLHGALLAATPGPTGLRTA